MASKKILKIGLSGWMLIMVIGLLASSLTNSTPSVTKPCKESSSDCSKNNKVESQSDIDFDSFSGKFFSSVSY